MSRRLAELDRLDEQGRAAEAAPGMPRRRGLGRNRLLYLLSVGVVGSVVLALAYLFPDLVTPRSAEGSHTRAPSSAATGPHAFMNTTPSGRPVSYDPCQPIHYVVNPAGMPAEGASLINETVDEIGKVSGLTFIDDGTTPEPSSPGARRRQHDAAFRGQLQHVERGDPVVGHRHRAGPRLPAGRRDHERVAARGQPVEQEVPVVAARGAGRLPARGVDRGERAAADRPAVRCDEPTGHRAATHRPTRSTSTDGGTSSTTSLATDPADTCTICATGS